MIFASLHAVAINADFPADLLTQLDGWHVDQEAQGGGFL
jgi:hypothetical protein